MRLGPYHQLTPENLKAIDAALGQVNGDFELASRLVGIPLCKLRNTVNSHSSLKSRWGHKRRGRPTGRIAIKVISPPFDYGYREASRIVPILCKEVLKLLPVAEQKEVKDWLDERLAKILINGSDRF